MRGIRNHKLRKKYVLVNGKYFHLPYAEDAGGIMSVRWPLQ